MLGTHCVVPNTVCVLLGKSMVGTHCVVNEIKPYVLGVGAERCVA